MSFFLDKIRPLLGLLGVASTPALDDAQELRSATRSASPKRSTADARKRKRKAAKAARKRNR